MTALRVSTESALAALLALAAATTPTAPAATASPPALAAALDDARSDAAPRHQHLLADLQARPFLESIDTPDDYAQAAKLGLHVGQIVDTLARNPAPSAQRAFRTLASSKTFLAHDERAIALIRASVNVRPAPRELVQLWDRFSRPDDGFTPTTIGVLCDNGSEPALRLLEKKLGDARHADDEKLGWMRRDMLRHRNDAALLQASERLLRGRLPARLRPALVEVLFDYRPGEWFKPAYGVSPPALDSAPEAARTELRKLGNFALRSVALSATQKSAVTKRLQELDGAKDPAPGGPG